MKQVELCEALGLSKGQVSKLVARGMPTDSVESAEDWRRRNLEPMMAVAHVHRKVRAGMLRQEATSPPAHQAAANPIDAVVFGVLPQLLFERTALLKILTDSGIEPTPDQFNWFAAELSAHLWDVLTRGMGFPDRALNLPAWMDEPA
ncbi:hypothetical protein [Thauera propionica]|uniref:hypothetical protein n=1 Tax=Thauera propionica TaxID=2019431 RepID=UPI001055B020|nr:hypothetical protein [Thauera propionica]